MTKINGQQWKNALLSGANSVLNNKEWIDSLNVFPIPDGDTGTNMSSTIKNANLEILKLDTKSIGEISTKFAKGMLLAARGNSGVILSQIFKGISVVFENKTEATGFDVVEAFVKAKEYAYKSVMNPVEGTILTVIKTTSQNLSQSVTPSHTIAEIFKMAVDFSRVAVNKTPKLLKILEEVGVTDSGGEGLYLILYGIYLSLIDKPIKLEEKSNIIVPTPSNVLKEHKGELGYCTEFIVKLKSPKSFKKEKFQELLLRMGESAIFIQDNGIFKIHIHVLKPGNILNFAQKFGEFLSIKSENMTLQANESNKAKKEMNKIKLVNNVDKKEVVEIISCNVGQGIINDIRELGANFIIEGGQSINPSIADFIQAINKVDSNNIIIIPNNPNVILVAQQVVQTITNKKIIIVPTQTQMQGLVAMMYYNKHEDLKTNQKKMNEGANSIKTGQITKTLKTTKIQGMSVNKNDYIALVDNKIIKSSTSKFESIIAIAKKLIDEYVEIITIYYGEDSTETDADEFASYLETHYNVKVEIKNGGQPTYNFLISFE